MIDGIALARNIGGPALAYVLRTKAAQLLNQAKLWL
jgi:hypothetical protein